LSIGPGSVEQKEKFFIENCPILLATNIPLSSSTVAIIVIGNIFLHIITMEEYEATNTSLMCDSIYIKYNNNNNR
jgi:hypothetical protein